MLWKQKANKSFENEAAASRGDETNTAKDIGLKITSFLFLLKNIAVISKERKSDEGKYINIL